MEGIGGRLSTTSPCYRYDNVEGTLPSCLFFPKGKKSKRQQELTPHSYTLSLNLI